MSGYEARGRGSPRRLAVAAAVALAVGCPPSKPKGAKRPAAASDIAVAAEKTYVPPGDLDEYYMFSSGGHSGQVFIYGCPSMRHLATIPVFAPYSATGYGFDDESKEMLGDKLTWGDVHHPALSETNGDYDGRWLFVNEMNGRIARIDLRDFKTRQILGPVPNISGNHGSTFITPEQRVRAHVVALPDPHPQGDGGHDRPVRERVQGRRGGHQDRPEVRPDVRRAGRWSCRPSTGISATPARRSRTDGSSSPATTRSAPPGSSR